MNLLFEIDRSGSSLTGVSELMKESVEGWFKLLSQEEGDFYAVPVLSDEGPMGKSTIAVGERRSLGMHSCDNDRGF